MSLPARFEPRLVEVLHPNLHRRYSGVTTTILSLAPAMARLCRVALVGGGEAKGVPMSCASAARYRRDGHSAFGTRAATTR